MKLSEFNASAQTALHSDMINRIRDAEFSTWDQLAELVATVAHVVNEKSIWFRDVDGSILCDLIDQAADAAQDAPMHPALTDDERHEEQRAEGV